MQGADLFDITVHKSNKMIRGGSPWTVYGRRCANAIYHYVQKFNLLTRGEIEIPIREMRKLMGLEHTNRYGEIIRSALRELAQPIFIQGADPARQTNKDRIKWDTIYFIIKPHELTSEEDSRTSTIKFQLSDTARLLIADSRNSNFTQLAIHETLKFRTAYGHAIYEYLKSWENKVDRIYLDVERLQIMLSRNSQRYKYFSQFKPLILKAIEEIREKTDYKNLTISIDKRNKIFWIFYNNDSKDKAPKQYWNTKSETPETAAQIIERIRRMERMSNDDTIVTDAL